jgi:hypothetical protein
MAQVSSFHTGRPLNLWERCSLQSFADHGHQITLYAYELIDAPPGITLVDASTIISEKERQSFFAIAPGAFALFSDLFRYELLARHGGWWVDTDVVCLSPTLPNEPLFIGRFGKHIPNAIMAAPAGHPILLDAVAYCRQTMHLVPSATRFIWGLSKIPGLAERYNLFSGLDVSFLFPIRGRNVWQLGDPDYCEELRTLTNGSPTLHLFQERFGRTVVDRDKVPPEASFLACLFERHGGAHGTHMMLTEWRDLAIKFKRRRIREKRWRRWRSTIGALRRKISFFARIVEGK